MSLQAKITALAASTLAVVAFPVFASPSPELVYAPTVVTERASWPSSLWVAAATIVTVDRKPTYIQVYLLNTGNNLTGAVYIDPVKSTIEVGFVGDIPAFVPATDRTKNLRNVSR